MSEPSGNITIDSFNQEQRAFIDSQIQARESELLTQYNNSAWAAQVLKKNGGKGFLNDSSYEQAINATLGHKETEYRKVIKGTTGIDWQENESFNDYIKRSLIEYKPSEGDTKKYSALETKLSQYEQQIAELSKEKEGYVAKEWNNTVSKYMNDALDGKQFAIPQGIEGEDAKELLELKQAKYKQAFEQRFEFEKDTEGNTFLKDKQTGNMYMNEQILPQIKAELPNLGVVFQQKQQFKGSAAPKFDNPQQLNAEQKQSAVDAWYSEASKQGVSPYGKEGILIKQNLGLPLTTAERDFLKS